MENEIKENSHRYTFIILRQSITILHDIAKNIEWHFYGFTFSYTHKRVSRWRFYEEIPIFCCQRDTGLYNITTLTKRKKNLRYLYFIC